MPCVCRELNSLQQIFTSVILDDRCNSHVIWARDTFPAEKMETQRGWVTGPGSHTRKVKQPDTERPLKPVPVCLPYRLSPPLGLKMRPGSFKWAAQIAIPFCLAKASEDSQLKDNIGVEGNMMLLTLMITCNINDHYYCGLFWEISSSKIQEAFTKMWSLQDKRKHTLYLSLQILLKGLDLEPQRDLQ